MSVFHKWKTVFIQIPKNASSSIFNRLSNTTDLQNQGNHTTFFDDMQNQDSELFESYFSFAIVRNPYDRFISSYEFASLDDSFVKLNFNEFVKKCESNGNNFYLREPIYFVPQYKYITIKNIILVDEIIKFENLNEEWIKISKKINTLHNFTPIKETLEVINATPHKMNKNWEDYYNEETKEIVYNLYKKDFEIFGYKKLG